MNATYANNDAYKSVASDATFASRWGEGLLGVGRLDEEAAREALLRPLATHGVGIDEDALGAVVEYSQHYPTSSNSGVTHCGSNTRRRGRRPSPPLSSQPRCRALPPTVADYYQSRYQELRAEGLLTAAAAVARLFRARMGDTVSEQELDATLVGAGIDGTAERLAALNGLNRLGYVWCPPGQLPPVTWDTGIPSLMTFVLENAPPH